MFKLHRIEGFAIISEDGMLANAAGVMPDSLEFESDKVSVPKVGGGEFSIGVNTVGRSSLFIEANRAKYKLSMFRMLRSRVQTSTAF